jgi:acyl carrier protein
MTDQEIVEKINISIAKEFELDQDTLTPETTLFEDMGLDSLDIVDLVIVLEAAFSFKIREEEAIRKIRTLGDIHTFVINKKREQENKA